MVLMLVRSGAIWLVFTLMNKNRLIARCNFSILRRDSNNFWKDTQVVLQISQSQIMLPIKTICFSSVRKRQMKLVKESTSWRSVILLQGNRSLKRLLIYRCLLMSKVTSLFLCSQLISMELFSL